MEELRIPKFPVYIPSKGRADEMHTAKLFDRYHIPYRVVVQPNQVDAYKEWDERGILLVLPEDDKGLVYARNWIRDHSVTEGHERHWQFDDDIQRTRTLVKGYRIPCDTRIALIATEDFTERYENVALTSLNYSKFILSNGASAQKHPPFYTNMRCYSCFLMLNSLPNRWRNKYNEDTDMTLQVLADGWCTVLMNAFMIDIEAAESNSTGAGNKKAGGQAAVYSGDGRLKMSRDLERMWPGVVSTKRKFRRAQHNIEGGWKRFSGNRLRLKDPDALSLLPEVDNYGMALTVKHTPKTDEMRRLAEAKNAKSHTQKSE